MKAQHLALVSLIILTITPYAKSDTTLPKAEDLISRYADQLYGDFDLDTFSLTQEGTLTLEQYNVEGPMVVKYKGADKYSIHINIFGSKLIRGCNGEHCWSQEFRNNMSLLDGGALAFRLERADFGRFKRMERYYDSLTTVAEQDLNDEPTYKVEAISKAGRTLYYYFAKDSGRLLATEAIVPTQDGDLSNMVYLSDFKQHGELLLALQQYETSADVDTTTRLSKVSFKEIPDSDFEPPEAIKQQLANIE